MKPGYKETSVGVIPEDWEVLKLGEVFEIARGGSPRPIQDFITEEEGYNWIKIGDTNNDDKYIYATKQKIRKEGLKKSVLVKENDFILSNSMSFGRPYIMKTTGCIHDGWLLLRNSKELVTINFMYYFLSSNIVMKQFKSKAAGSTVNNLNIQIVKTVNSVIPPLPEQEKIAAILTTVDDKIESIGNLIIQATELKKGLMQKLFSEGIDHTEFKDSPVGKIPVEWEVKKGEDITVKISKGASPKWQGFDYQEEGLLFVTSENVRDGFLDIRNPKFLPVEFNDKIKNSELFNGDILINIVGASIGRGCQYHSNYQLANINQAVCLFRTKYSILSNFILYYLQEEATIKRLLNSQNGSARQNLSLTDIKRFSFLVPPQNEQQQIAQILTCADDKITILKDKKIAYTELKKGLMQKLLTGEVRVKVDG